MSRTLHFIDRLLAIAQNLQVLHRNREALHYLRRLAALELPAAIGEEVQARLGEINLHQGQYRRACRHFAIALLYQPESANYHWQMANALRKGRYRDLDRAATHYEKSLAIDPEQPRCLADFGSVCLRLDRTDEGLAALMRAVDLAPNDAVIVSKLLRGLCRTDRKEEALDVLRAARFRNPRDGRFRRLYNNFMFDRLHEQQESQRQDQTEEDSRMILPFALPEKSDRSQPEIREDDAQPLAGPRSRRRSRRPGWKHG
jgi:tetratricopeptide (TPR) repeat protein